MKTYRILVIRFKFIYIFFGVCTSLTICWCSFIFLSTYCGARSIIDTPGPGSNKDFCHEISYILMQKTNTFEFWGKQHQLIEFSGKNSKSWGTHKNLTNEFPSNKSIWSPVSWFHLIESNIVWSHLITLQLSFSYNHVLLINNVNTAMKLCLCVCLSI